MIAVDSRREKTVAKSRVEISHLMRPQHANFAGVVHGGTLLNLMDEAFYLCASRYAETYCVTVAVDQVEFHSPVRVGEMVTLRAAVNAVGRSSMEVGIQIIAEDPQNPAMRRRTHRSFFTMVAMDAEGKPVEVPRLVCETPSDFEWRCEALLRKEARQRFNRELEGACRIEAMS